MKIYRNLFFVFVALAVFGTSCIQAEEEIAKPAPDFKLQDLSQKTITLSDYKGKQPVILFFWTTWCPFCRKEIRILNEKYPELRKEGWELFAINLEEPVYKIENFLKNYTVNFKVLLDRDASIAYAYDLLGIPTYVFIDKKGNIRSVRHTFPQNNLKELISE